MDIVLDDGQMQVELLSLRHFKPSAYSPSCAALHKGFHYENPVFFPSFMKYPTIPGTDAAKVGIPRLY
jgi:hypothetical protein